MDEKRQMPVSAEEPLNAGQAALQDALRVSVRLLRWIMVVLLLVYLASGVFIVQQHEKAMVLRFGKLQGRGVQAILGPGLHWTWPKPIAEVVRVPAERVQTLETDAFWYFDNTPPGMPMPPEMARPPAPPTLDPQRDGYALSGDANLLHSRWAVRYKVSDPIAYAFHTEDLARTLETELRHAVVRTSARMSIDRALRTEIASYRDAVEIALREGCNDLGLGVQIDGVEILALAPPRQVGNAFDVVSQSEQQLDEAVSGARKYAVRAINEAKGKADRIRAEGRSASEEFLSDIRAHADAFKRILPQYRENPDGVATLRLQDTIRRIGPLLEDKYLIHGPAAGQRQEVRIRLSPEQKQPGAADGE